MTLRERPSEADPEEHFRSYRNSAGAPLAVGACVALDLSTPDRANGINVALPTAATLSAVQGIVENLHVAWPDQENGRVQVRGLCTFALVQNHAVDAIVPGDILIPVAGQNYLVRSGPGNGVSGFFIAAEAIPASGTQTVQPRRVHIQCP